MFLFSVYSNALLKSENTKIIELNKYINTTYNLLVVGGNDSCERHIETRNFRFWRIFFFSFLISKRMLSSYGFFLLFFHRLSLDIIHCIKLSFIQKYEENRKILIFFIFLGFRLNFSHSPTSLNTIVMYPQ